MDIELTEDQVIKILAARQNAQERRLKNILEEVEYARKEFMKGYSVEVCGNCEKISPCVKVDIGGLFETPSKTWRCFNCLIDPSVDVMI